MPARSHGSAKGWLVATAPGPSSCPHNTIKLKGVRVLTTGSVDTVHLANCLKSRELGLETPQRPVHSTTPIPIRGTDFRYIGGPNLRHRRSHKIDYVKPKLLVVDYVLENPDESYMPTEEEKVSFFTIVLKIPLSSLPTRPTGLLVWRLQRGMVVGWFQGRMEFGPRALRAEVL